LWPKWQTWRHCMLRTSPLSASFHEGVWALTSHWKDAFHDVCEMETCLYLSRHRSFYSSSPMLESGNLAYRWGSWVIILAFCHQIDIWPISLGLCVVTFVQMMVMLAVDHYNLKNQQLWKHFPQLKILNIMWTLLGLLVTFPGRNY
jgi:hypothetical protein